MPEVPDVTPAPRESASSSCPAVVSPGQSTLDLVSGLQDIHPDTVTVYFLSSSTGITAETMGNALLIQFPQLTFERHLIPFISTVEEAQRIAAELDRAADAAGPGRTIAFMTVVADELREILSDTRCPTIDFYGAHLPELEKVFGDSSSRIIGRLHGLDDTARYNSRMAAVEYAIEHDDGQSLRALDRADVILIAPSRCGKTPTTMYLALHHGLFVANYPLVDEDLTSTRMPRPIEHLRERCFGLLATPARLHEVRTQRRPNSTYSSLQQCQYELRQAQALYTANDIPVINSTTRSVEEMSTVIIQILNRRMNQGASR